MTHTHTSQVSDAISALFADEIHPIASYRTPTDDRTVAHRLHIGYRDATSDYAGVIVIRDQVWAFSGLQDSPHGQRIRACDADATYRDLLMAACAFAYDGAPTDMRDEIFCIRGCAALDGNPSEPLWADASAAALIRVRRRKPFL